VASGLGGLLAVGRRQKEQALSGLTRAAELETQRESLNRQLKEQRRAAEMNVVGTVGGIGGAHVASQYASADAAAKAAVAKAGEATMAMDLASGTGVKEAIAAEKAATAAIGTAEATLGAKIAAAGPTILLAIAGGYLLKKIFD
tara:strand:- start:4935 stop:5366 length:432 start_codon:yes stop_codon:yes gene_type:complete